MNFDRVASVYHRVEKLAFGGALQRARVSYLGEIGACRVLVLGDGDGRFLEVLLDEPGVEEVHVVEASARMVELARARVNGDVRVTFFQMGLEEFQPDGEYDLLASHFFLDCFEQEGIGAAVRKCRGCLADGGEWLVSDFQVPERGWWRRLRATVLLWVMYRFFRIVSKLYTTRLTDPDEKFEAHGMRLVERRVSNAGFLRADRWRVAE